MTYVWSLEGEHRRIQKAFRDKTVVQENGCIIWVGRTSGKIRKVGLITFLGKDVFVHRLAFYIKHGKFPVNNANHTCDNSLCVNWKHLYDGTQAQNIQDMHDRKRYKPRGYSKEIRALVRNCLAEKMTHEQIRDKYKISLGTISAIRNNKHGWFDNADT